MPGCGTSRTPSKRIVLMLSAYPTKHARIGNAVGLDTPASAVALLRAMRDAGYDLASRASSPASREQDGDALIHALIEAGGQDADWLTEEQLAGNPVRIPRAALPRLVRDAARRLARGLEEHWGPAPGELYVDGGPTSCVAALRSAATSC